MPATAKHCLTAAVRSTRFSAAVRSTRFRVTVRSTCFSVPPPQRSRLFKIPVFPSYPRGSAELGRCSIYIRASARWSPALGLSPRGCAQPPPLAFTRPQNEDTSPPERQIFKRQKYEVPATLTSSTPPRICTTFCTTFLPHYVHACACLVARAPARSFAAPPRAGVLALSR